MIAVHSFIRIYDSKMASIGNMRDAEKIKQAQRGAKRECIKCM
jgi:hypothetical protein